MKVGKRSKRQRAKLQRDNDPFRDVIDPHVAIVLQTLEQTGRLLSEISATKRPLDEVKERRLASIARLTAAVAGAEPARAIEVIRLACLPWSFLRLGANREGGATRAEVFALIALSNSVNASTQTSDTGETQPEDDVPEEISIQPLTDAIHEVVAEVDTLLVLSNVEDLLRLRDINAQPLDLVAHRMRSAEIWMRNTSYADQVRATVLALFTNSEVAEALRSRLGFDGLEAVTALETLARVQNDQFNVRMNHWHDNMDEMRRASDDHDPADLQDNNSFAREWNNFWEPDVNAVSVSAQEVSDNAGLDKAVVLSVLEFFSLDIADWTPERAVSEFTTGNNPVRTNPVVAVGNERYMLIHEAFVFTAVREGLEQHLKNGGSWDSYQTRRGEVLERRTSVALDRMLPMARSWHAFKHFVPNDSTEVDLPPQLYTKRVEADHLYVIDDIAIIIEDKAVALSPQSRAGETRRLRGDLTRMLTKADEQAGRIVTCIKRDAGLQLDHSWLDLSMIREVHTIAVSLEDLVAATATADLIEAGFLDEERLTWTVSTHDLELISELIESAPEFILYLRRRRDPMVTKIYSAPDELDLLLYFFEEGLYVEPDPEEVRRAMPHLPPPTADERRRFDNRSRGLITSRTDQLDVWHDARLAGHESTDALPDKPRMVASPLQSLVDDLERRGDFGWVATSATLISGAMDLQEKLARAPEYLVNHPRQDGRPRSITVAFGTEPIGGWLLVWQTRANSLGIAPEPNDQLLTYLRAKKYQQRLARAAAFIFDQTNGRLLDFIYDGTKGELPREVLDRLNDLLPADSSNISLSVLSDSLS